MVSIVTGSLIISLLHALIPNHWLPVIAIGRKEHWSLNEISKVTFICAVAHGISTTVLGIILSFLGAKLNESVEHFTKIVAPVIMIALGLIFIYRHHKHKHFHIDNDVEKKKSNTTIIIALVIAMFFSPCLEIEAYFLLAGAEAAWLAWLIAAMYLLITTTGMVLLVRFAYNGLLKLNWHRLEHNAGIITGFTLIATGIVSLFIF